MNIYKFVVYSLIHKYSKNNTNPGKREKLLQNIHKMECNVKKTQDEIDRSIFSVYFHGFTFAQSQCNKRTTHRTMKSKARKVSIVNTTMHNIYLVTLCSCFGGFMMFFVQITHSLIQARHLPQAGYLPTLPLPLIDIAPINGTR